MSFTCLSLAKPIENVLIKIKGSKFIGYAFPVKTEEDVKQHLQFLQKKYPDATHHCYAYRLGYEGEKHRANDDGEPSGTAGLPIYNQLLSHQLTYTLVVSIRYFGGTKLGVSGLIKAYKTSAEETLMEAKTILLTKETQFSIQFPYTAQSTVMRILKKQKAKILKQTYLEDCMLTISIPTEKSNLFSSSFDAYPEIHLEEII